MTCYKNSQTQMMYDTGQDPELNRSAAQSQSCAMNSSSAQYLSISSLFNFWLSFVSLVVVGLVAIILPLHLVRFIVLA